MNPIHWIGTGLELGWDWIGSSSVIWIPIEISFLTNISNGLPIRLKIHRLAEVQDRKGTPFEYFRRVLSTNRKPGFWALDQWEASISARFWTFSKLWAIQSTANWTFLYGSSNGVWFYFQWNANCLPIECHLTVIWMSINCQLNVNSMSIQCQCNVNAMSMQCQCNVNAMSMQCQCNVNAMSIQCQCNVNAMLIIYQCNDIVMLIMCQSNANEMSIKIMTMHCKCTANWISCIHRTMFL